MRSILKGRAVLAVISLLHLTASVAVAKIYDVENILMNELGAQGLAKTSASALALRLELLAEKLQPGDALILPGRAFGDADLTLLPNDVEISGGAQGSIYLGGYHSNMAIVDCGVPITVGPARKLARAGRGSGPVGLYNSVAVNSVALNGGPFNNTSMLEQNTFGKHVINGMKNSVIVYMDYNVPNCSAGQTTVDPKVLMTGDCSGSRIYHMVETNYCLPNPAVVIQGVTGPLTFLVGDTERGSGINYLLANSTNIVLGTHRMFHPRSTGALPDVSIKVSGGSGNKFYMTQDIGAPKVSLDVTGDPKFEIWGGFWEDAVKVPDNALQVFSTPNGFGQGLPQGSWHEPVEIQDEIIFKCEGLDLTDPANASKVSPPKPPLLPATNFPTDAIKKAMVPRHLSREQYGAAVLEAGADPTGKRASDGAFAKVLAERGILEIPAGIYKVTKPIVLSTNGVLAKGGVVLDQALIGQGKNRTIIRMDRRDIPVIKYVAGRGALAKADSSVAPGVKVSRAGIHNVTIDGGKWGIDLTCVYIAATRFTNLLIKNSSEAGVMCGDGIIGKMAAKTTDCNPHEFDQNRFIDVTFENTGDYGVYNNMGMVDKGLYLNCHFSGQKKAGLAYNFTHMFNTSIIQCTFKNIDGPGLDMYPIDASHGYTPNNTMIESCEFIECGNATRPAIDYNWCESQSISNTKVVIKTKPWKYAYIGTAQIMTDVNFDVDITKMVAGGAALALRSTRQAKNARPTGNILRNVTATGPIKFINDAPAVINMDTYFAGKYDDYAWAYPHLLVDCQFTNAKYAYTLVQGDKNGAIKQEIQLTACADCGTDLRFERPAVMSAEWSAGAAKNIFDLQGRSILPNQGGVSNSKLLPRGVYIMRRKDAASRIVPVL